MTRTPYMPLFFGDFLASTAEWEGEERSLYLTLLGHQWAQGSLPAEPRRLCKLVGWDQTLFDRCWPVVSGKFQETDGRLTNGRLESHREKAVQISDKRAEAGKAGAAKRWQKDGNCHDEPMANATTLSCHLIQSKEEEDKTPRKRGKPAKTRMPEGFALTDSLAAYVAAKIPDCNPPALFEQFCGQAKAKAWEYADWDQAFQTYVRNASPNSGHWAAGQYPKGGNGVVRWR